MRSSLLLALLLLLGIGTQAAAGSEAEAILKDTIAALRSRNVAIFDEQTRVKIRAAQNSPRAALATAGPVRAIELLDESQLPSGLVIEGRTLHATSMIYWTLTYSTQTQLVEIAGFSVSPLAASGPKKGGRRSTAMRMDGGDPASPASPPLVNRNTISGDIVPSLPPLTTLRPISPVESLPAPPQPGSSGEPQPPGSSAEPAGTPPSTPPGASAPSPEACAKFPQLCVLKDDRTVEFLFATTRRQAASQKVSFTGERLPGSSVTFGAARIRIPDHHLPGEIKLPKPVTLWGYTLWEQKMDESKHFVIKSVLKLDEKAWGEFIRQKKSNEALVFVHGFNNSFEDALYRHAQIIWDLQYTRGMSILFTWASNGRIRDYVYDRDSAEGARDRFLEVLRKLKTEYGIEKIHVLAHSMGNFVVLPALRNEARSANPLTIAEIIMAAPDVDRDYFLDIAPHVRKIAGGMTLYASSADKALKISKSLVADIPRAGDVPDGGPIILPNIDTIDVTALGDEFLGLNHDVFATSPTVMADIKALLASSLRPPGMRTSAAANLLPAPDGVTPSTYWRYVPLPRPRPGAPPSQNP